MEFFYSGLAAKMREIKANGRLDLNENADLLPDNVIRRATDGEKMPLDFALRVMQAYFPDDANAVDLFHPDTMPEGHEALSFGECRKLLDNALLDEVMTDDEFLAADAYLHDTKREGVNWAIPAGYVLGHAAGVRSERARMLRKQQEQGTEPHESSDSGKWSELIGIMNELSGYSVHYVILLAKLYKGMEESGKVSRRPWYD